MWAIWECQIWKEGDEMSFVFWEDGRFCPRHVNHAVDIAHLPTPERKQLVRRRIIKGVVLYLILTAIGIFWGLYGSGQL